MSNLYFEIDIKKKFLRVIDESDSGLVLEALHRGGLFFWESDDDVLLGFASDADMIAQMLRRENMDKDAEKALLALDQERDTVKDLLNWLRGRWGRH